MKQWFSLEKFIKILFLLFIISLPFQTRLVYFTENSHLGSAFLFYNTLFLYASDIILIALALLLGYSIFAGMFHVKHTKSLEALLWILGLAVISLIVSRETILDIQLFGLFKLFLVILLFIALLNQSKTLFSHESRGERLEFHVKHIFLWLILAISVVQGVIALTQYFTQESIGLGYLGEEYLRIYLPGVAKFQIPGAEKWVFDRIFDVSYGTNLVMRPYGTFSHPNVFGAFMFFSSLISLHLLAVSRETPALAAPSKVKFYPPDGAGEAREGGSENVLSSPKKNKLVRMLIISVLSFQIFAGFLSFSRVAVVSWIAALILWFILLGFVKKESENVAVFSLKKLFLAIIVISAISITLLFPQYLDRGGVVSYGTTNQESISDRALYQEISWQMIKQNPLLGVGYKNFVLTMDNYSPQDLLPHQHQPVHNIYLLIAAETGVLGLAAFLLFIFFVLRAGWNRRSDILSVTFFVLFIMLLVIGLFDHYPLTIQQGSLMLFLSAGIIVGRSLVDEQKSVNQINPSQQPLPT